VLAALLSAFMSSDDTTLLSASTILVVDIVGRSRPSFNQERALYLTRWGVVLLGLVSTALALYLGEILSAVLFAFTVFTAGVILPVIAGFFKQRLGVTPLGALVAIAGGGSLGVISKLWSLKYLDVGAMVLCGVLLFAVSFIDGRRKSRRLDGGVSI